MPSPSAVQSSRPCFASEEKGVSVWAQEIFQFLQPLISRGDVAAEKQRFNLPFCGRRSQGWSQQGLGAIWEVGHGSPVRAGLVLVTPVV